MPKLGNFQANFSCINRVGGGLLNIKLIYKIAVHDISVSQGVTMKGILILLCLVTGSLGYHLYGRSPPDKCDSEEALKNKIAGQKARLDDIRENLSEFKENLQSRISKAKSYEQDLSKLRKRLSKLTRRFKSYLSLHTVRSSFLLYNLLFGILIVHMYWQMWNP